MHELGIATDLFKIVEQYAKKNSLKKVTKITIKLGAASGIEKDFLEHSLKDHVMVGTFAEGSKLNFKIEKVKFECRDCGKEIKDGDECPYCRGKRIKVTAGEDVYVESIEGK